MSNYTQMSHEHRKLSGLIFLLIAVIIGGFASNLAYKKQILLNRDAKIGKALLVAMKESSTGLIQIDDESRIIGWDSVMTEITGWSEIEMDGAPLSSIMPESISKNHEDKVKDKIEKGDTNDVNIFVATCAIKTKLDGFITVRVREFLLPSNNLAIAMISKIESVKIVPESESY